MIINSESNHPYNRVEGGDANWKLYWPHEVTGEQSSRKVVGLIGHESQIQTNAPMMVFVTEGTVMTIGRFVKILDILLILLVSFSQIASTTI